MPENARTLPESQAEETGHSADRDPRTFGAPLPLTQLRRQVVEQGGHPAGQFVSSILVPINFSTCSERALKFAIALARQCQANLMILHVIDINTQSPPGQCLPAADLMKRLWKTGFEQMGRLAFSLSGQVDAQTAIEEGLPCDQIIKKSHEADLLILGKPCSKPEWSFFPTHTAQRVLERAACPVVVVHDRD